MSLGPCGVARSLYKCLYVSHHRRYRIYYILPSNAYTRLFYPLSVRERVQFQFYLTITLLVKVPSVLLIVFYI